MGEIVQRRLWWIVAAIAAAGIALRIAAAQGGLWLDEAWSAVMAAQAGTPAGVFFNINHDNNHHLNSLWLQLVGFDASPLAQRALSIATGTAAILVAASIGTRRGAWSAVVAALLFAFSPILVTYGSEARGYAPMLLALLIGVRLIDRWIDTPEAPPPATALAIATVLGLLSQLTMVFGLAVLGAAAAWTLVHRLGWRAGIRRTGVLFAPAIIAAGACALLFHLAAGHAGGFAFGATEPFALTAWLRGLAQITDYTFGYSAALALAAALASLGFRSLHGWMGRLILLGLIFPVAPALLQLPNSSAARYYLITTTAMLLGFAFACGHVLASRDRKLGVVALAILLAAMAGRDWTILIDRRADPAQALTAIAARAPAGSDATVERARSDAILIAAAASAHYPLQIRQTCPAARFLFIERDGDQPFPISPTHCDANYREIAGDTVQGLSGTQWKLYERSAR